MSKTVSSTVFRMWIYGIWEVGAGGRNRVFPMGWPVAVALDKDLAGMPTKAWSSSSSGAEAQRKSLESMMEGRGYGDSWW